MFTLLVLAMSLVPAFVVNASTSCDFAGFIASCPIDIDNVTVTTTALINNCKSPMEINFILETKHGNISWTIWEYTFQITNAVERLKLPRIGGIPEVLLDINLSQLNRTSSSTSFHIEVQYIGPRNRNLGAFLKTSVSLPNRGECARDKKLLMLEIVLGTILSSIAFSITSFTIVYCLKRYHDRKKDPLVHNMETEDGELSVECQKENFQNLCTKAPQKTRLRISDLAKRKRKLAEAIQAHYRSRPPPKRIIDKEPATDSHDGPAIMISTTSGLQLACTNDLRSFLSSGAQ